MTLSATNSAGTGTAALTLTVTAAPVITSAGSASGTVGNAFSYQITATNSPTSFGASGIAGRVIGQHCERVDLGNADGGGNIDGDAERDQQRRNRYRHADADGHGGAGRSPAHGSASGTVGNAFSYQITATNSPTSYGATRIAGRVIGQHCDRV